MTNTHLPSIAPARSSVSGNIPGAGARGTVMTGIRL